MSGENKRVPKNTIPETPASKMKGRGPERDEMTVVSRSKQTPPSYIIPPGHPWAKAWLLWVAVALVGLLITGVGFLDNRERQAFAYLAAFEWGLTLALGGLFFVLLQHITSAGWSVVVRRGAEQLMGTLPVFALLFVPIIFFREALYPWAGSGANEPAIVAKAGYLNLGFWLVRAVLYFGVWTYLSQTLLKLSRDQDSSGDPKLTLRMRRLAAPGILLFALTLTFAAFDWVMSLEPEWYSTMFGVYSFAGAVISVMAFLIVLYTRMHSADLLEDEVTAEHYHDIGKLMFAFTVFWAYIGFAQYLLIWYANIPEETQFYMHRQEHGWGTVAIVLVLGHFFFPFFLMLSRHAKRSAPIRLVGGLWILFMHFIDMYWVVMPNKDHTVNFSFGDLGCWMLVAGTMMAVLFRRMVASPILPVRDPLLGRSLRFENA